jgi:hypothetical protein
MSTGFPGGSLAVEGDGLTFETGYSEPRAVRRADVDAIVIRRQRAFPFFFRSFITVRLTDDSYFSKMFVPSECSAPITADLSARRTSA